MTPTFLLQEYHYLTPSRMAALRGTSPRAERANLNRLYLAGKVKRAPFTDPDRTMGSPTWLYYLSETSGRTLRDHELDITDYHVRLQKYCDENKFELVWQQKHMTGKFYPDAYFSINGLHYFLEIERQKYGNVRKGKPSIIRKANDYYAYYNSDECEKRWGFRKFRVIFQLKAINPTDFLARIEKKHRMYWIGVPNSLTYKTNMGDELTFSDV